MLVSIIRSQSSISPSSIGSNPTDSPALLIKTSTSFHFPVRVSTADLTSSSLRISKSSIRTFAFTVVCKSFFSWVSFCFLLPEAIISYPFSARRIAVALPIPEVAPVTKAIFLTSIFFWIKIKIYADNCVL